MAARGEDAPSYSASSRSIHDIPPEVIDEILFFMDAKTLCSLRCTSRWWNAHISAPSFFLLHYSRSLRRGWPLLQIRKKLRECSNHYDDACFFSSTDLGRPWHYNFWKFDLPEKTYMEVDESSAFGLIILHISNKLCIYNPATRSVVVDLPPCNDTVWSPCLALGLAHSTNQFKVVCFCLLQGSDNLECMECRVLTLTNDHSKGWRKVASPPFGENLNLLASSSESAVFTTQHSFDKEHLFRFDLETEQWSEVKLPPFAESFARFLLFKGSPCLVVEKTNLQDEVWLPQDDNLWVKKWVLNKSPCMTLFTPLHHDEERGRILMKDCYGTLKWYRIQTGTYEMVREFPVDSERRIEPHYIPYVETLASFATLRDIAVIGN